MGQSVRVMHYLNQFFAGMGSEDKSDVPLGHREGPVGPGKRLQSLLGNSAEIVVTAYCGDNYFAENTDKVLKDVLQIAKDNNVEMVVAGPAIAAGRYGFACSEVCHFISTSLDIYCVSAMFAENPGVDGYKQYKDKKVFFLPMADTAVGVEDALSRMAIFVSRLASSSVIGSPAEDTYIPRGIRMDVDVSKKGAERAVEMLLDKLAGRSYITEIPYEGFEETRIAPPITNIKQACIALASTAGLTASGNPYGFKMFRNTKFEKYHIGELNSMMDASWEVIHGGYGTDFMMRNPNYGVPLDACRQLENEGKFGKLYPYFYGTTGVEGTVAAMEEIGKGMVADMKAGGVDAVLMVPT